MFEKRQNQVVNFNQLLEQMRENEEARMMIDRIKRYLNSIVELEQRSFKERLIGRDKDDKFYTFEYPFLVLRGDLEKIVDIIEYDMPEVLQRQMEEDYTFAAAWNREIEAKEEKDNGQNEP